MIYLIRKYLLKGDSHAKEHENLYLINMFNRKVNGSIDIFLISQKIKSKCEVVYGLFQKEK